ncbi:MAG TPA: hypothetical protein VM030_08795 [Acidimicrobiales bacterium]|nr:hypothetical protein [Acidimicrobiales bacterium]
MSDRPADGLRHRLAAEYSLPRRRLPSVVGWSVGAILLATITATAVWGLSSSEPAADRAPSTPRPVGRSATTGLTAVRMWPEPAYSYVDGILVMGDRRWAVGAAGDEAALVDLDCDGDRTPVVWSPRGGVIATFSAWASEGRDQRGRAIGILADGERVELRDVNADGCADIVAVTDDSFREVVVSGT